MEKESIEQKIEKLETRNRFLNNEISRLSRGNPTDVEQKRIDGNFEEIGKNQQTIIELKTTLKNLK